MSDSLSPSITLKDVAILSEEITSLRSKVTQAYNEKEKLLSDLVDNYDHIIEEYRRLNLFFTHPSIDYHTAVGPILANPEYNVIVVYNPVSGEVLELNFNRNTEEPYPLSKLITEGHFNTAVEGIRFMDKQLNVHIAALKTELEKMNDIEIM
ncbi:hypothetical protein [Terribacillus saccharophilus]|uniref:Uncharacterized protein n=1 Tax=Terribacillus saccharophilus TaxID=361277 RepID=A0ABX4H0G8_9BACI|nr:hypothetical protein [Terribacillus saccharophilus]PAD35990.1 hypothetical protein CHH56_06075 [Terribacillus saccharophilus]PAD96959.1 hypothetical protein CHH50_06235 [Terribacillus saccharophilus]PAE00535.1 hypothetical protein CHH48_07140 [Terribacillus saccharophilus]